MGLWFSVDTHDWWQLRPAELAQRERRRAWDAAVVAAHAAVASVPAGAACVELATRQGLVLTPAQARACGLAMADARRLVRRSTWTAPRAGVLCVLPGDEEATVHGRLPEIAASALALVRPDGVIGSESAAAVHGVELLKPARRPILTALEANGGGEHTALVRTGRLRADQIGSWFGVLVTCPARTVVDIARVSGRRAGIVVADSALAGSVVTAAELRDALTRAVRWPGVRRARDIVELASPLSESALESLARLMIVDAGLPAPELQVRIPTAGGTFRVDGLWRRRRVVFEADGMVKYAATDALTLEKRRQEYIERAGFRVVRLTWDDVTRDPIESVARLRRALHADHPTSGVW